MHSSNLLEPDFAVSSTTGKRTQMMKENSKGMRDLSASNEVTFQGSLYNAYTLQLHKPGFRIVVTGR